MSNSFSPLLPNSVRACGFISFSVDGKALGKHKINFSRKPHFIHMTAAETNGLKTRQMDWPRLSHQMLYIYIIFNWISKR
jgi:hypothetical protein